MQKWTEVKKSEKYINADIDDKEEMRDAYIENVLIPNNVSKTAIKKFEAITDNEIEPIPTWDKRVEQWDYKYHPNIIKSLFNRFYIPKALRSQLGTKKYTWANVMETDVYKNAPRIVDKKYIRKIFLEEIQGDLKKIVEKDGDIEDGVMKLGTVEDRIESLTEKVIAETNKRDPELSENWEKIQKINNIMNRAGSKSPEFAKALAVHIDKLDDVDIPKQIKNNEWAIIKYIKTADKDQLEFEKDWDLPEYWRDKSTKVKNIHRENLVKAEYQEGVESSLLDDPIFNMVIGGGLGKMGLKGLKAVGGYARGAFDDLLFGLPGVAQSAAKGAKKFLTGKPLIDPVAIPREPPTGRQAGAVPSVSEIAPLNKPLIDPVATTGRQAGAVPRVSEIVPPTKTADKAQYPIRGDLTGEFARKRAELHGEKSLYEQREAPPLSQEKLKQEAEALVKTDRGKALEVVETEDSPLAIKVADKLIDDSIIQYRQTGNAETLKEIQKIVGITSARTKYAGQIIKAADRNMLRTPNDYIRFMGKEIDKYNRLQGRGMFKRLGKLPKLSPDEIGDIIKKIDAINLIKNEKARSIALAKYTKELSRKFPFPLTYKITALRKAGLLSGPRGIATDVTSNLSHAVGLFFGQTASGFTDSVRSLVTKSERIMTMPRFKEIKSYIAGFGKGIEKGYHSHNLGYEKWDHMSVNFGKGEVARMAEAYEQGIHKVRGYIDYPFYKGREAASIVTQARVEAINLAKKKKLTGDAKAKFIKNYIVDITKEVPDHIALLAKRDAEIATFRTETQLGKILKSLLKRNDISKHTHVVGELVTPFTRTMPSLVSQTAEMGTGIPSSIIKALSDKLAGNKFNAKLFVDKFGKGMAGAGFFMIGVELERRGLMNIAPAETEGESLLMKSARYGFGMVETPSGYIPLYPLGPPGILIHFGGMFQHYFNESGNFVDGVIGAFTKGTKLLTQSAYIQTIKNMLETATGETSPEQFVGRTVKSFIPAIVTEAAQAIDPKQRRIESIADSAQAGVPLLREQMEPQIGIIGEEIESGEVSLSKFFNPLRAVSVSKSPVIKEMLRLRQEGHNTAPPFVGDRKGYEMLTPEETTLVWKKQGEYIKKLAGETIKEETYQKQSDLLKAITLKNITEISHNLAYVEIIRLMQERIKNPAEEEMLESEIEQIQEQQEQIVWELIDSGVIRSSELLRKLRNENN